MKKVPDELGLVTDCLRELRGLRIRSDAQAKQESEKGHAQLEKFRSGQADAFRRSERLLLQMARLQAMRISGKWAVVVDELKQMERGESG